MILLVLLDLYDLVRFSKKCSYKTKIAQQPIDTIIFATNEGPGCCIFSVTSFNDPECRKQPETCSCFTAEVATFAWPLERQLVTYNIYIDSFINYIYVFCHIYICYILIYQL